MNAVTDPQALMEAFAAFTKASENLQLRYEALQDQLAQVKSELETVVDAVPFAIWVLGEEGSLRFTNRPEGLDGSFQDGPAPWEPGAPSGLRHFKQEDGRERFMEQESRPTAAGQIITLRDITEQHLRAQQATREERLQAMGLMAAELAHEIRNPLGSLALFAGMLVEDLQDQPSQLELAARLQDSVQRLNTLVTNTLTFSRDLVPKPAPVPLRTFWEEARKGSRMASQVDWQNHLPPAASWMADPELLRQVAVNLLQNAARAMEDRPNPVITLSAAREEVDGVPQWHLVLEDTGCGIAREDLSRIFDPFYSTFGGGTGLGLAVSHRILVAHGGLLYLESRLGTGTKVHLRLPSAV